MCCPVGYLANNEMQIQNFQDIRGDQPIKQSLNDFYQFKLQPFYEPNETERLFKMNQLSLVGALLLYANFYFYFGPFIQHIILLSHLNSSFRFVSISLHFESHHTRRVCWDSSLNLLNRINEWRTELMR